MKRLILKTFLFSVCIFLFSCNNNDDQLNTQVDQPFFNINSGNKWVYKIYQNNPNDSAEYVFTGVIDSVKIVGTENIQGFMFAKKSSKKTNRPVTYSYIRINNSGHLVEISDMDNIGILTETSGLVLHPGMDSSYTYNFNVAGNPDIGNVEYHLYDTVNINVEGINYLVLPYHGIFTPSTNSFNLQSKTVGVDYTQNIGLVKSVTKSIVENYTFEERLISYQLN